MRFAFFCNFSDSVYEKLRIFIGAIICTANPSYFLSNVEIPQFNGLELRIKRRQLIGHVGAGTDIYGIGRTDKLRHTCPVVNTD